MRRSIDAGRSLGRRTIAEWAEDRRTIEALVDAAIDFSKGYAVVRP